MKFLKNFLCRLSKVWEEAFKEAAFKKGYAWAERWHKRGLSRMEIRVRFAAIDPDSMNYKEFKEGYQAYLYNIS